MKKPNTVKITFIATIIVLFRFTFYWNTDNYIISRKWQATQGSDLGDFIFIEPEKNDYIKGKILYSNGKPHCKVIFCFYKILFLADLKDKYYVKYVAK
jgi:hypothetical protein